MFGTTKSGIDLGDATLKAIRIDLLYSSFVVLGGALIGSLIGVFAGYRGGFFDEGLMRVTDVTYSIPFLVLVIAATDSSGGAGITRDVQVLADFSADAAGATKVEVHQTVRDLKGSVLADKMVGHIFRIEDGLIRRFDIR